MKSNWVNLSVVLAICLLISLACKSPDANTANQNTVSNQSAPANSNTTAGKSPAASPAATAAPADSGVTMANFNKIKTGMKYEEVTKILGKEGEVLSETEVGGYKTVMYQWKAEGFANMGNMNAMFQKDKLVTKSQFGLK